MTGYSQQNGKIKIGRGEKEGGGGGEGGDGKGHLCMTMLVMEHGPSHSPPGFFSNVLIAVHII